jgi:hypothetical protein
MPHLRPALALGAIAAAASACSPFVTTRLDPDAELPLLSGYRDVEDSCSLLGESAFTRQYLDDAADLVACPIGSLAEQTLAAMPTATQLGQTMSYRLYRVQRR